jgi:hypothetical protein
MNEYARPEVLSETWEATEHHGDPGAGPAPREVRFHEASPRDPVLPGAPDEGAFETFIGGEGI